MSKIEYSASNSNGVLVRCPNKNCNYTWHYSGRFIFYATCPSCRRNVRIPQNKVESLQSVKVGRHSQIAAVTDTPAPKELMQDDR